MGYTIFDERLQAAPPIDKKEIQEINQYFVKNPGKIFRLYWFEDNNFSFLKDLKNISKLEISYSKLSDFGFLENVPDIEYLNINEISGNPEITPIGNLKNLKTLNLNLRKSTKQNNLKPLNNLSLLEKLYFQGKFKKNSFELQFDHLSEFGPQLNCIDINEIGQLKNLKTLKIFNQKIDNLTGFEKILSLDNLFIHNVKMLDQNIFSVIFLINGLKKLSMAYIKGITDFTFIKNKSSIETLILWSLNGLESIKGIENLIHLKKYSQCGEHKNLNIIDFSELLKLKELKEVEIKIGKMNKEAEIKLNKILGKYNK
jgi:hypothetical protein